jgi:NADH dehydrogenase
MNLVVGATGFLGSEICRRLAAQGKPLRAMVRPTADAAKVEHLKELGAEIVEGNLHDPVSLEAACQGATAVICTVSACPFSYSPPGNTIRNVDIDGVTNLIEAARTTGVKHFVYTSFSGQINVPCPLENAKRTVEQHLKDSGLAYTILRPSYFMEAWLTPMVGFDPANATATIYGAGHNPISWISLHDVAQFAVASLDNPAARNATLEMGGPQALSPLEVVAIFERAGGKSFNVQHVPEEALAGQLAEATDDLAKSFPGLMLAYAHGDAIDMHRMLQTFPLQLTTVQEYAQHVLG